MSQNNPLFVYQMKALNKEYQPDYVGSTSTASNPACSSMMQTGSRPKRRAASRTAAPKLHSIGNTPRTLASPLNDPQTMLPTLCLPAFPYNYSEWPKEKR